MEAWERLAQARQRWQQESEVATAVLLRLGIALQEREEAFAGRERAQDQAEQAVRRQASELAQARRALEAERARLAAADGSRDQERQRLLAGLHDREDLLEQRLAGLETLRQRWQGCRCRQLERLRARRAAWDQLQSAREADLSARQTAWEQQQLLRDREQAGLRQEVLTVRGQRSQYERQLDELRDQVESLVWLLLDDGDTGDPPRAQAA